MNTQDKLNRLAELQQLEASIMEAGAKLTKQAIPAKVSKRLAELNEQLNAQLSPIREEASRLGQEIRNDVLQTGESVKGIFLHAIFSKGRVSWNNDALAGYAEAHPEILKYRKIGEPTVAIREVKRES